MSSLVFLFLFSFLTSFRASAQYPRFFDNACTSTSNYTRNSTYLANLRTLLSSFSSRNTSYSTGFQNSTVGQVPDKVTGLFLCRGDISPQACRNCVVFSVKETLNRCPNEKEAVLYYDECILRYSDQNILSTPTLKDERWLMNPYNMSSDRMERFESLVLSTMTAAATEAANSSTKFSTRKTTWSALQDLYGLVQCTPDLTAQDCLSCLQQTINQMAVFRIGGGILRPSCIARFELYLFYNETTIRSPPLLLPPVSTPPRPRKNGISGVLVVAIVVPIIVALLLSISGYCFLSKRTKKTYDAAPLIDGYDKTTIESLQLDYRTIQAATNNFSNNNKIGRGGFGEVYKGTFSNGTEVAVKRLSKSSRQGDAEFKNEVVVVAKLQHRNLVRLLGFSLEGEERILVYEYVPNKCLDYFLFDLEKQGQLDWTRRYMIIGGIARGILYLHQDSRLKVIHRDLKASNILLDSGMNPKVADFGMARIFGMNQTQENTNRIVGTYGYMSPEYAMSGQFSMKSDVYSFGVLVLEIISGRKNSSFYETDGGLVTYAYRLWSNGTSLDLVDPIIFDIGQKSEMVRCIHIGLLCVQEDPIERPTLSTISVMFSSNTVTLPVPRKPGVLFQNKPQKNRLDADQSTTTKSVPASTDDSSITDVYPR